MEQFLVLQGITKQFDNRHHPAVRELSLQLKEGEIITLLGPSGCGKTTTLRLIAGFETPTSGSIRLQGRILSDEEVYVPPEARSIGMVFQDYALFPHLNVLKNVMFGLQKWPKKERKKQALNMLRLAGLEGYAERFPHQLSGGQQQRVALTRALAPEPKLLLLDEPFSNLDAKLRERMREELVTILRKAGTTAILVTHDQQDAFAVSDRVVVMNEGRILQEGTPATLYSQPATPFVAQFFGQTNLLPGEISGRGDTVRTVLGEFPLHGYRGKMNQQLVLSIRPENSHLVQGSSLHGVVEKVYYQGPFKVVQLRLIAKDGQIPWLVYAPLQKQVQVGQQVDVEIDRSQVQVVGA